MRRNYLGSQENLSDATAKYYTQTHTMAEMPGYEDGGSYGEVKSPYGKYYVMGNSNALELTTRARSFIGTNKTYEEDKNPGAKVDNYEFSKQGQRWNLTIYLPSTAVAVAVKAGKGMVSEGIGKTVISDRTHVLLTAVDIKAMGDMYALKTDFRNNGVNEKGIVIQTVDKDGKVTEKPHDITSIPRKVISVQSSEKTSRDDMTTSGTH